MNFYQFMRITIHHGNLHAHAVLVICWPLELFQQIMCASCGSVVTYDKAGRATLYHLQFPGVVGCVWIPDTTWHFFGWDSISQSISHSWSLFKSSCNLMAFSIAIIGQYRTLSLANNLVGDPGDTQSGRSLM